MQKVLSLVTAALVTVSAHGAAQVRRDQPAAAATKPRTGYVLANGINYYYEIHGQGAPLLLLHGELGNDSVDVMGYSLGGGVALRLAVQHPGVVRRLVLVSTPYAQDGFYPEMLPQQAAVSAAMADQMKQTPMYQSYVAVAPRPQDF